MTRVEYLLEIKEDLTNQLRCISDSFVSNTPNERFRDEWERVQERLKIVNDLIKDEKQRNLPEPIKEKIESREFNFIDENFGEQVTNTLLFNSNSFVIISLFCNEMFIKRYEDILDLLKEFISNRNELNFLKQERQELLNHIENLEAQINEKKNDKI